MTTDLEQLADTIREDIAAAATEAGELLAPRMLRLDVAVRRPESDADLEVRLTRTFANGQHWHAVHHYNHRQALAAYRGVRGPIAKMIASVVRSARRLARLPDVGSPDVVPWVPQVHDQLRIRTATLTPCETEDRRTVTAVDRSERTLTFDDGATVPWHELGLVVDECVIVPASWVS